MEGVSVFIVDEENFVVGLGKIVWEKNVNGIVRQLSVHLSKIVILVEVQSGTTLVCQKDKGVAIGSEGEEALALERLSSYWWGGIW